MKVKLRLGYLLIRGGLLSHGDSMEDDNGDGSVVRRPLVENWNDDDELNSRWAVESFAPRENNGSQPVPDDFPVVVYGEDGRSDTSKASYYSWSDQEHPVVTWKPDLEKLIEQQIEYDKHQGIASSGVRYDLMYQGPTTEFKINKKGNNMPIYTQEMKDAGKCAPIGSEVRVVNNSKYDLEYGEDILGLEVTVRSDPIPTSGGACIQVVEYEGIAYCFVPDMIFPFKSKEEIELEEAKEKQVTITVNDIMTASPLKYNDSRFLAEYLQKKGVLSEIILPLESNQ